MIEIHHEKTMQKIAEMRRKRTEMSEGEGFNPHEAMLISESGEYYLAKLLNKPHLEEESMNLDHCVGTSDSYIHKMKRGKVEIFSIRTQPVLNQSTEQLEESKSLVTIEYDVKNKIILKIRGFRNNILTGKEPYFKEVLELMEGLSKTHTDEGGRREIHQINNLNKVEVKEGHLLLLGNKQKPYQDYDPEKDGLIFKSGLMELKEDTSVEDLLILSHLPNVEVNLTHIKPEYKNQLTAFKGSIKDESDTFSYEDLKEVGGDLNAQSAQTFNTPELREVGGELYLAYTVEISKNIMRILEESNDIKNSSK